MLWVEHPHSPSLPTLWGERSAKLGHTNSLAKPCPEETEGPQYVRERSERTLISLAYPLCACNHFRRVAGYRAIPKLVTALRARDVAIDREPTVANSRKAA
jgi:hypothetical protein